jgi:hypothetical protein
VSQKEFFINAIQMIDVDGQSNIPTVLFYPESGPPLIGSAACASAQDRRRLNEDFKVDLGLIDPSSASARRKFATARGERKSAAELTADFIHEVLAHVNDYLRGKDVKKDACILVAEPLAMQQESVSADWLANYRSNLRRILLGKGFHKIDFLPEPFAVFQYYRHGIRPQPHVRKTEEFCRKEEIPEQESQLQFRSCQA